MKYIVDYTLLEYMLYYTIYSELYCESRQSFKGMTPILPLFKIAK